MRLGFSLPQIGAAASPEAIRTVATRAEEIGYDSLWVSERLLYPIEPKTPYPGSPEDGMLPYQYKRVLDPIESLTYAAALTQRIAIGTSTLNIPYYNPVMLARRLTTLDVLSGGRLRVSLGIAWSEDECDAVGVPMRERGRRADEFLRVLKAIWTTDPVEFHGEFYHVPKSIIEPKPVQKPHPPLYMGAFVPRAFQRIAAHCDGWNPVFLPIDDMERMYATIQSMAQEAGRGSFTPALVVRANGAITEQPQGDGRRAFTGSLQEIAADFEAIRRLQPTELFFDPTQSPGIDTVDDILDQMRRFWEIAHA